MGNSNTLEHAYASKYYDPVKAHEYYLRTRELKGTKGGTTKRSTRELTGGKKDTWAVTKAGITEAKKFESKLASQSRAKTVEAARQQAKARRTEIATKLKAAVSKISAQTAAKKTTVAEAKKSQIEAVKAQTERKLAAVAPVSKGLSKEARAVAAAKRAKEIATIRGDAKTEKQKITSDAKNHTVKLSAESSFYKAVERNNANARRAEIATFTKAAVSKARNDWEAQKERIKEKYEQEYDREFESIKRS